MGARFNLHSQAKPRLHRAILRWGGMAQLFSRHKSPWPHGGQGATLTAMKTIRRSAWAAVCALLPLTACSTLQPPDGDAVECDACDTIWIRLFPSSGAPGVYRLNHGEKRKPCGSCGKLALGYCETGQIPKRCPDCGGNLTLRPVDVTP